MADGQGVMVASGGSARGRGDGGTGTLGAAVDALIEAMLVKLRAGRAARECRPAWMSENQAEMLIGLARRFGTQLPVSAALPGRLADGPCAAEGRDGVGAAVGRLFETVVAQRLAGANPLRIAPLWLPRSYVDAIMGLARRIDPLALPDWPKRPTARASAKRWQANKTERLIEATRGGADIAAAAEAAGSTIESAKRLLQKARRLDPSVPHWIDAADGSSAPATRIAGPTPKVAKPAEAAPPAGAKAAGAKPGWGAAEEMAARGYAARGLRLTAIAALMRRPYAQIAGAIERGRAEREKGRAGA